MTEHEHLHHDLGPDGRVLRSSGCDVPGCKAPLFNYHSPKLPPRLITNYPALGTLALCVGAWLLLCSLYWLAIHVKVTW
jgi:hypothetical protein